MKLRTSKRIAAVTLALLAAAQLAGCGGSSGGKQSNTTPPPGDVGGPGPGGGGNPGGGDTGGGDTGGGDTGGGDTGGGGTPGAMAEGFFVDAAVAGLSYTTSSELSGVTNAEGRYEYREGDTVTFSLGGLALGTVQAQGIVTPMTIARALTANNAAATETVAVNLLVLLQSLDSNGNPEDGITFTTAIREAVTANAIDLTAGDSAFMSSLTNLVSTVSAAAPDATLDPVTRTEAVDHFQNHAPSALAGIYVRANENFEPMTQKAVTLTIFRNGRYLLGGQHDLATCNLAQGATQANALAFSDADGNGMEFASYSWDPLTSEFAVDSVIRETDGYCGLNEPAVGTTNDITVLESHAKGLVFKKGDGTVAYRFARAPRAGSTVAGGWVASTALLQAQPATFMFFPSSEGGSSGRYLMVDAAVPSEMYDTSPGIEEGCYSLANDELTVELNPSMCADAIDTNDTAGLSDVTSLETFVDENDRLVIDDGEIPVGLTRLPIRSVTHEALAGAWIIESAPGTAPADEPNLFMLTVFEDGRFLFGTQQNDDSCTVDYPTGPLDVDGNGVEYGTLSLTEIPGLVVPTNVTVDTNGECGLYHNGKTGPGGAPFQQAYLVVPNDAGDALMMWANDEELPAGIVFKRVPSVPNQIWGAWLWSVEGASDDQIAVSAYLQGGPRDGVMFEVSTLPDVEEEHIGVGLLRESFDYDGRWMESYSAGYAYCVDTEGTDDDCSGEPGDPVVEEYIVNGDMMGDDVEDGAAVRIPSPVATP